MNLEEKEQIEINFWRDNPMENPTTFSKENMLNKLQEASHFNYKLVKYHHLFKDKKNILEIGAGQGWASCYLKKFFLPQSNFTVTDISIYAIASLKYWESLFEVKILNSLACKSYEIPIIDQSFDFIFCYAAAHHFIKIDETLSELKRLLQPGGVILFLYEPTCSSFLYPIHYKYVNTAPHSTPEDVLVPSRIKQLASKNDLFYENIYDPHQTIIRSIGIHVYFKFLRLFPFLQKILPGSSDMIFRYLKDD